MIVTRFFPNTMRGLYLGLFLTSSCLMVDYERPSDAGVVLGDAGTNAKLTSPQSCVDEASCSPVCGGRPGSLCTVSCEGVDSCKPICPYGSLCNIICRDTTTCNAVCQPGTVCTITCDNSDCRQVQCQIGSSCSTTCINGGKCPTD